MQPFSKLGSMCVAQYSARWCAIYVDMYESYICVCIYIEMGIVLNV